MSKTRETGNTPNNHGHQENVRFKMVGRDNETASATQPACTEVPFVVTDRIHLLLMAVQLNHGYMKICVTKSK